MLKIICQILCVGVLLTACATSNSEPAPDQDNPMVGSKASSSETFPQTE